MSQSEAASMSSQNGPTQEDIDALKGDLAALRDDLRSFVSHAKDAAQSRASGVRERLAEAASQASEKGRAAKDRVQTHIEDNPFMAVGVALCAGLLIGAMVARRTE